MTDEEMADEEMAEKYAKGLCKTCKVDVCRYSKIKTCTTKESLKQAYLAGLKAGRPQWHKVADGDLPKENKLYFVQIKDNGLAIAYFNGQHWETRYNLGESGHCVETVIAWREIPTFEE